jgi:hypothetical protein
VHKNEARAMTEKVLSESSLGDVTFQIFDGNAEKILESVPNLSPEDCSLLGYSVLGYHLGKSRYFGLTFPLKDGAHIDELRALSNGYLELRCSMVRMGVRVAKLGKNTESSFSKAGKCACW